MSGLSNYIMVGIYLGAGNAQHPNWNLYYQDINGKREIGGDMLSIDLNQYDFIIATPPCNFWSIARGNRLSDYALKTKHLLPQIIEKLVKLGKPFIVENVRNKKRFFSEGVLPRNDCYVYFVGRHTYFSNLVLPINCLEQRQDFKNHGYVIRYDDMENCYHQGGYNVHLVIEVFCLAAFIYLNNRKLLL